MRKLLILLPALVALTGAQANVSVPSIFATSMVLQQQTEVKIWGWAKPFEPVKVTTTWDDQTYEAKPSPNAEWSVSVKTPEASRTPYTIKIQGYNEITIMDVLIGEVILASGQSNMEWSIGGTWGDGGHILGYDDVKKNALQDDIRMFNVDYRTAPRQAMDVTGHWIKTSPETVDQMSAIAYIAARRLNAVKGVPVGVVNSSWGGTPVECWTPQQVFDDPAMKAIADRLSPTPWGPTKPGLIYNAMLGPLAGFKFAACLWYQGEQNLQNGEDYGTLLKAFVANLRKDFGADLPFVFAQIAPYKYDDGRGIIVRNQQRLVANEIANSALVVIGELGEIGDIHPRAKVEAGNRFGDALLYLAYNDKHRTKWQAPLFEKATSDAKGKVTVTFKNATGLSAAPEKTIDYFELADQSGNWQPAKASVNKLGQVIVQVPKLLKPTKIRYAWNDAVMPTLHNAEGLVASCFIEDIK